MEKINSFYKNKKILVTGATGFKGSWLCCWLLLMGAKVYGTGYSPNQNKNLFYKLKLEKKIKLGIFDIRDKQKLDSFIFKSKPSIIFHLAAQPLVRESYNLPIETWKTNVIGTANLLQACRKLNNLKGKVIIEDTKNCYLRSENRLIVGINLNGLIVVETNDAVLIMNKDKSQEIKGLVSLMKERGLIEASEHKRGFRPWGSYISIASGENWLVKLIEVNPEASLSLQKHNFRAEHWIVVKGTAEVRIEDEESTLNENQSIYIPLLSKHRLSNPGESPLILIEVQSGNYLGEDDIVRFDDNYGRIGEN